APAISLDAILREMAERPVPAGRARPDEREEAVAYGKSVLAAIQEDAQRLAEQALKGREDLMNRLAVHQFFDNALPGTLLFVHATAEPVAAVETVIGELRQKDFNLQTLAVLSDWSPDVADRVGKVLAQRAEGGVMVQVLGQYELTNYTEAL